MPVRDWARAIDPVFHDFHLSWIAHLSGALNHDVLPDEWYALSEDGPEDVAHDLAQIRSNVEPETWGYADRRVVVRHASDDRVTGVIEIVSPGTKRSRHSLRRFVNRSIERLSAGVHLVVVDLFPPGPHDPRGIHAAIWQQIDEAHPYAPPPDKPLTLASYRALPNVEAYIEPAAVGDELQPMPLFLAGESYVPVPLEPTAEMAYRGVPRRWREALGG
jgi:hypothetical protein